MRYFYQSQTRALDRLSNVTVTFSRLWKMRRWARGSKENFLCDFSFDDQIKFVWVFNFALRIHTLCACELTFIDERSQTAHCGNCWRLQDIRSMYSVAIIEIWIVCVEKDIVLPLAENPIAVPVLHLKNNEVKFDDSSQWKISEELITGNIWLVSVFWALKPLTSFYEIVNLVTTESTLSTPCWISVSFICL